MRVLLCLLLASAALVAAQPTDGVHIFTGYSGADAACLFNESNTEASSVAVDTAVGSYTGAVWTVELNMPHHWKNVYLAQPADCSPGFTAGQNVYWTAPADDTQAASGRCNNSLTWTYTFDVSLAEGTQCNRTFNAATGQLSFNVAPVLHWTVLTAGGDRTYEQIIPMQINFQTYINASATFDALGNTVSNIFVKKAATTGFNTAAQLEIIISFTVSWPYYYNIVGSDATNTVDSPITYTYGSFPYFQATASPVEPALVPDNLGGANHPLVVNTLTACSSVQDSSCTQEYRFIVRTAGAALKCYLDGTFIIQVRKQCRPGVIGVNCSVSEGEADVSNITVTARTSSVCINNTVTVSLGSQSWILKSYIASEYDPDPTRIQVAFANGQTVNFLTRFNATNGQFVKSAFAKECMIHGLGTSKTESHTLLCQTGKATQTCLDTAFSLLEIQESALVGGAHKSHSNVNFKINAAQMSLSNGERRTMSISCQYVVAVQGTLVNPHARRRLLQVGATSNSGAAVSRFQTATFGVETAQAPSSGSSASTLAVSPTIAAACVLAVAAAVLVVVAVRRSNKRKASVKQSSMSNEEMVNLPALSASSSATNLQTQA